MQASRRGWDKSRRFGEVAVARLAVEDSMHSVGLVVAVLEGDSPVVAVVAVAAAVVEGSLVADHMRLHSRAVKDGAVVGRIVEVLTLMTREELRNHGVL